MTREEAVTALLDAAGRLNELQRVFDKLTWRLSPPSTYDALSYRIVQIRAKFVSYERLMLELCQSIANEYIERAS